jgi:hypothetical protein
MTCFVKLSYLHKQAAMLQQKFTMQVTTLPPDCDDITRFDGIYFTLPIDYIFTYRSVAHFLPDSPIVVYDLGLAR